LSTPLLAKHFIEAGSARLAYEQFTLIGRQVRHRVLNIFSGHPLMHVGHIHQQVVRLLATPTSGGNRVWSV